MRNEKAYIPAAPFVSTAAIGFISGIFGPISVGIGIAEILIGMHFMKKNKSYATSLFAGGVIATFMGIGEVIWGSMSITGNTTTASLTGWKKILMPSAYGFELLNKAFTPKVPSFTPTPQTVIETGVRTVW